jgi:uncharacterized protein (DUF1330 family)
VLKSAHLREAVMAKGYLIAQVDVHDQERYHLYATAISATLAPFGGRFLVRAGRRENLEGSMRQRLIIIEFGSFEEALAFYRSAAYQEIIPLRTEGATADIVIIEGVEDDLGL